ncbi:MAG: amidohydrolase family protein [Anaerolineae bacterium]|nr:amidohydrolase family protein [Anaerolineae bacterium]
MLTRVRLPGLIDVHVHLREPGFTHKEDLASGTRAALAGGISTVLDMPNTSPPITSPDMLLAKARLAAAKAVSDVGLFVGATADIDAPYAACAPHAAGLKVYVNETFGSLRIESLPALMRIFQRWPGPGPIAVHAEGVALAACLALTRLYDQRLHVCHVARAADIQLIARAKSRGGQVTCEVTPHHLFLTQDDLPRLGALGYMRPTLGTPADRDALWEHLDCIDCFATDHAPHTLAEKQGENPPPGVPGLETMLPLLLTAVHERRLTLDQLVERLHYNPARIFGVPIEAETWTEVDLDARYTIDNSMLLTRCGWTPFAGMPIVGRVTRVVLRGQTVFEDGRVLALPGSGRVLFGALEECGASA